MDLSTEPEQPDLAYRLPRDAYWLLIHTLCTSLPPPPVTDTPDDVARRDNAAIAQLASLLPATLTARPSLAPSSSPLMPRRWTPCGWRGTPEWTPGSS